MVGRSSPGRCILLRYPAFLLFAAVLVMPASSAGPEALVFCAPGYPGTTEEARPTMDALAAGVAAAAGWKPGSLTAVYHQDGPAGLARLKSDDAVVAMVTLPFYLRHREELGLKPLLAGVAAGEGDGSWSLVAATGRLAGPGDLDGWTVAGLPAYYPALVHGPVLSGWGKLPPSVEVLFTARVLSALRKASRGDTVAVLLDRAQVEALPSLPYGESLEVVHVSGPMPTSLLCAVGGRLPPDRLDKLVNGLRHLHEAPDGVVLLESIRMERFRDLDMDGLQRIAGASD